MKKVLLSLSLITLSVSAFAQNSWTEQSTNLAASNAPREIDIVDPNTVWITVSDGTGAAVYPRTYSKTVNGGTTWTAGNITGVPANGLIGDISALDANTAWVVSAPASNPANNANGIWKTTNGGSTWARQGTTAAPYNNSSFANVIHFWDANEGFTAGDPVGGVFQIFRTTNGGTTWTAVTGAPTPITTTEYGLTGVKYVQGNSIWMGTTKGRILRSSDKGATWTVNSTPALDFGSGDATAGTVGSSAQMAFKDANNGLMIVADGANNTAQTPPTSVVLYATADAGLTWEPVDTTGTFYFGGIDYVPGTENTYVSTGGYTYDVTLQGSAFSKDGGLTWTNIDAEDQRGDVSFYNSTTGWTGNFVSSTDGTGGIFKFAGDLSLAVNEASAKNNLQVYPNPVGDVVNLTANKEVKSVTIYDLSGKVVKTTKDVKQINVSNLAKGTYILQANYGSSVENTKIIKK